MKKILFALFSFFSSILASQISAAEVPVIAYEKGFYTSLSNHAVRWLKSQDIQAKTYELKDLSTALAKSKIAFLIGFDSPKDGELATLRKFTSRGGKLVVFYSSSQALADMMGVQVLGFKKASYPGEWSRMDFNTKFPTGLPAKIRQTSTVLQRCRPIKGKGRVIATWCDRKGKSSGEAAWIATSKGYWMSHVLLADGDETLKARLLASICGSIDPSLWNAKKANEKASRKYAETKAYAQAQSPKNGEIRAVWDHTGCGLYPGNWPKTIKVLKEAKITDLFVNVAGAGFAHYPSNVLPRSKIYEDEGDQLKACLKAAEGSGIRVHAWILCFNTTRSTPERLEKFSKLGWRLKTADGKLTDYLDPSNQAVQDLILKAIDEIQDKYKVSGIHLDFVRWYEKSKKPKNAALTISKFVATARRHVKRPCWLTTAVLGKYPTCIASVGQDWESWLDLNIVDYVVPMDYTENMMKFEEFIHQHSIRKSHARRTIAGIGVTANESRLEAKAVIDQIKLTRKYSLAGVSLFDLDQFLETDILPFLKMGIW